MTIIGAGFAVVALRREDEPEKVTSALWTWEDIVRWTVRLPTQDAMDAVVGAVPPERDVDALLASLPEDGRITWAVEGARTSEAPREVVRLLRERITEELSEGKVHLSAGWVLSQTEWNLLQLAGGSERSASHAA